MDTMNIMQLKMYIVGFDSITLPQMQKHYGLTYAEASTVMKALVDRGWLSPPDGIYYTVEKEKAIFYDLTRENTERLFEELGRSSGKVLNCMKDRGYSTVTELETSVDGFRELEDAAAQLTAKKLIYLHGDRYYLCIPAKTADMLKSALFIKGKPSRFRAEDKTERDELNELLDGFFGKKEDE